MLTIVCTQAFVSMAATIFPLFFQDFSLFSRMAQRSVESRRFSSRRPLLEMRRRVLRSWSSVTGPGLAGLTLVSWSRAGKITCCVETMVCFALSAGRSVDLLPVSDVIFRNLPTDTDRYWEREQLVKRFLIDSDWCLNWPSFNRFTLYMFFAW